MTKFLTYIFLLFFSFTSLVNAGLNPYTLKQIDTEMKGHFPIKKGE